MNIFKNPNNLITEIKRALADCTSIPARKYICAEKLTDITTEDIDHNCLRTERIGARAFQCCKSLKDVELATYHIGPSAFEGCTSLEEVYINNSSQPLLNHSGEECIIERDAFKGCTSLKKVTVDIVNKIGDYCFANCTSLEKILPNENMEHCVDSIGEGAFFNCKSLKKVALLECPSLFDSVTEIKPHTFEGCSSLESLDLTGIPIFKIGPAAFRDCTSLKEIIIPDTLEWLYLSAFEGCTSLENIRMVNDAIIYDNIYDVPGLTIIDDIHAVYVDKNGEQDHDRIFYRKNLANTINELLRKE